MTISILKHFLLFAFVLFGGHQAIKWDKPIVRDAGFQSIEILQVNSTTELDNFVVNCTVDGSVKITSDGSNGTVKVQLLKKVVIERKSTLRTLSLKLFETLPELEEFYAVDVSLHEVNLDDFRKAKKLRKLILSNNTIEELKSMVFLMLENLVELDLSWNNIWDISKEAFEGLKSIRKIDLSNNRVAVFHEKVLVNLLGLGIGAEKSVQLNLSSNFLTELAPAQKASYKNTWNSMDLDLSDNKLTAFGFIFELQYGVMNLRNNAIESMTSKISILHLDVSNNKMRELSIGNMSKSVNAADNLLTKFTIDTNSQLETLTLSGTHFGNEVFRVLKGQKLMKTLDLSNTDLTTLNADSFADLPILETLRLDQNNITEIDFGVFARQAKLVFLNISYNALHSINLKIFGDLSFLKHLDISGNFISIIKDHDKMRQILPNLTSIGLEGNLWSCNYLANMKNSLTNQNISIIAPKNPIKNKTNLGGIECLKVSNVITPVNASKDDVIATKMNVIIDKVNDMESRIEGMPFIRKHEKAETMLLMSQLRKEFLDFKSEFSNSTNMREVREFIERLNNVSSIKQQVDIDSMREEINLARAEVLNMRMQTEAFAMTLYEDERTEMLKFKEDIEKHFKNVSESNDNSFQNGTKFGTSNSASKFFGFTSLEMILMALLLTTSIAIAVFKSKNYLNSKFDQIIRQRRGSVSTLVTYDSSNIA